jgi:hypothetical protein
MSPPRLQIKLNLSRTQVRARLALRQPANSSSRKSLVTQAARLALRKSRQICCVTSSLQLRKAPEMVDLKWRDRMV